jgi:hypothetical protein
LDQRARSKVSNLVGLEGSIRIAIQIVMGIVRGGRGKRALSPAMLTTVQFRDYLQARRDARHSLAAIGELILAEILSRSWPWPHW